MAPTDDQNGREALVSSIARDIPGRFLDEKPVHPTSPIIQASSSTETIGSRIYTVPAVADKIDRWLNDIFAKIRCNNSEIGVTGVIREYGNKTPNKKGMVYQAYLFDPSWPQKTVEIEVHSSTLQRIGAREGDRITAYGSIILHHYNGRPSLRFKVDRAVLCEAAEAQEHRTAQLPLLETIRQVGAKRNPFPTSPNPSIALLCSSSSRVRDDFREALGDLHGSLPIRHVDVSMTNPADIAEKIASCSDDVMVLIRGGGDPIQFAVFETPEVLEALGKCRSFRLLALGHTENRTVADCIADRVENVPADAGHFLRRKITEIRKYHLQENELRQLRLMLNTRQDAKPSTAPRQAAFVAGLMVLAFAIGIVVALLIHWIIRTP